MSTVLRALEAADRATLGIIPAVNDALAAKNENDTTGYIQSSVNATQKATDGTGYMAHVAQKSAAAISALPLGSDSGVSRFLQGLSMTQIIAGIGLVSSTLGLLSHFLSIKGQEKTAACLYDLPNSHVQEKETQELTKILNALKGLNHHQFFNSLPDYLKKQYTTAGESEESFQKMITDIEGDQPANAYLTIKEIKTGVLKKEIFHLVSLVGCIFGIAASIALIVGCPLVGLILLSVVGMTLTITCVLMKKGWVENRLEGFNWRLCVPEFLRKKLKMEVNTTPTTQMVSAQRIPSPLHRNLPLPPPQEPLSDRFGQASHDDQQQLQNNCAVLNSSETNPELIVVEQTQKQIKKNGRELKHIDLLNAEVVPPRLRLRIMQEKLPDLVTNGEGVKKDEVEASFPQPQEEPKRVPFWKKWIPSFLASFLVRQKEKVD